MIWIICVLISFLLQLKLSTVVCIWILRIVLCCLGNCAVIVVFPTSQKSIKAPGHLKIEDHVWHHKRERKLATERRTRDIEAFFISNCLGTVYHITGTRELGDPCPPPFKSHLSQWNQVSGFVENLAKTSQTQSLLALSQLLSGVIKLPNKEERVVFSLVLLLKAVMPVYIYNGICKKKCT